MGTERGRRALSRRIAAGTIPRSLGRLREQADEALFVYSFHLVQIAMTVQPFQW